MIGETLRNYRIVAVLGHGGMGIVYLAEHTEGIGKKFAIRSLSPELSRDPHFRDRFYQKAKNQALLSHPNIVQMMDFFEKDGQFFEVIEYVEGQTLSELIKARGRLKEKDALSILRDILKGLEFAHSKSMIHGDIQPSNILIDKSGIARITPFETANLVGGAALASTGSGALLRSPSPWYMSPEQLQGLGQLDLRTDIYSLGVVLYEMLAGDVPFIGLTDFGVMDQQVNAPPPNLHRKNPEISEELAAIVLKAMAKNPAERYQNCTEFLQSIGEQERQAVREVKRKGEEENRKRIEEEQNRAGKFFFSYARADSKFVLKLAEDLRSKGTSIWLDQLDIPGGARWDDAVEEALHASPGLLVVLSPASVNSDNVKDEISFGLENRKTIVPILHKECAIPLRIKRFQYIDFRVGYEDGFERLIQALKPVNQLSTGHREKSDRRNFHFSWKLSFRGVSAFLSVTLVGILAIYLVMSQSPTGDRPIKSSANKSEVDQQIAYNLIQTASEKASLICGELERVKLKREGLKLAGQVESSLIDLLKKQIQDLDKNIAVATAAYGDLITQLASLGSDVVDSEFEQYMQSLTKKSSFVQIPKARMMKLHYDGYLEGKRSVNASMMEKDCVR